MSLVLWNELCPEFYQKLNVGTVMYLQNYTLKQSYSHRSRPQMDHHRMNNFNSVGMYRPDISCSHLYIQSFKATAPLIYKRRINSLFTYLSQRLPPLDGAQAV